MATPAEYPEAGRMMRQAREAAGLTQAQAANHLGTNHVMVSRWDRGKRRPKPDLLRQAAELYGVAYEPLASAYGYLTPHQTHASSEDQGDLRERVARLEADYAAGDRYRGKLARLSERERRAVEALVDELLSE
jgi:transcriptional regulator with XRE-family HTH domain